jgi:hypothetical protein
MALASLDDINTHLPDDKLTMSESEDELYQIDAERIVKGYLSGVFSPTTLAAWGDPSVTDSTENGYVPGTVRAIVGRLIAAAFYTKKLAEDVTEVPSYAQKLYDEGIAMLRAVMTGDIILEDVVEQVTTGGTLTNADFFPNDTTSGPLFTMDQQFAGSQ